MIMPHLNTLCTIEYKSVSQESLYGTESITWTTKAVVWVEKQDVLPSRSEEVSNDIAIAKLRARIRARYRADINSSMRCTMNGEVWQIITPPAMIGRNEYMEFMVEKYST